LYFEASCVGGVPIIRTLNDGTQANNISSIVGIINGTTNYILTKMEACGSSYQDALKEAQSLGYAEFNPTADVEGFDASYKLSILSSLAFSKRIPLENVYREGITGITQEDIAYGKKLGYKIKLLAIGKNTKDGVEVRVHPAFVPENSMLASVSDSFNAVKLVGDSVGEVMLYGRGAGALPTGSAIVSDIIYAGKHPEICYSTFENTKEADKSTKFITDFSTKYFIRLRVLDKVGVLSKMSGVFAKNGVSLKEVKQDSAENDYVNLIIITHETRELALRKTLEKLSALEDVIAVDSLIRVEE
jgi:homoserine dehydrogenase